MNRRLVWMYAFVFNMFVLLCLYILVTLRENPFARNCVLASLFPYMSFNVYAIFVHEHRLEEVEGMVVRFREYHRECASAAA